MSVQRVTGALRRAGFQAAIWTKSGQVRGWGSWTRSGFKAAASLSDASVEVRHIDHDQAGGAHTPMPDVPPLDAYAAALEAAGFTVVKDRSGRLRCSDRLVVKDSQDAQSSQGETNV